MNIEAKGTYRVLIGFTINEKSYYVWDYEINKDWSKELTITLCENEIRDIEEGDIVSAVLDYYVMNAKIGRVGTESENKLLEFLESSTYGDRGLRYKYKFRILKPKNFG